MVFFELDKAAENLVRFDTSAYDSLILEISANAPDSFLQLSSLVPSLKTEADEGLRALQTEARRLQGEIAAGAKADLTAAFDTRRDELRTEIDNQKSEMTDHIKSFALRWGGASVGGLILGVALVWLGLSVYLPRLTASYADVDAIARRAVQERAAALDAASAELRANRAELDTLRQELQSLKQQNANIERRIGNGPNQRTRR